MADESKDPTQEPVQTPPGVAAPGEAPLQPVPDTPAPVPDPNATAPAPVQPASDPLGLDQETAYKLPSATLHEHEYQRATVIELRRLRHAIENLPSALLQAAASSVPDEVELKEPAKKVKHKRAEEPLSMVEPEPQKDVTSLVEVDPNEAQTSKPKRD